VKIIPPLDSKISKAHFSVLLANCSADNQFQDAAGKNTQQPIPRRFVRAGISEVIPLEEAGMSESLCKKGICNIYIGFCAGMQ
jgi:hypothetical protein